MVISWIVRNYAAGGGLLKLDQSVPLSIVVIAVIETGLPIAAMRSASIASGPLGLRGE